jgi:hypothetical protein
MDTSSTGDRRPPRFVPTLTEVVHLDLPAAPDPVSDVELVLQRTVPADELIDRVMDRLGVALQAHLAQQTDLLRAMVRQALEQELQAETPSAAASPAEMRHDGG